MRLKLIVAYDGRPYSGWQSQADNNAVQDLVEGAFRKIVGERVVVHGSGRTDAGVHAVAQCAHVEVANKSMKPGDWLRALNANLPNEIRIMRATKAAGDFHARFSAKGKVYRYRIWNGPVLPPEEYGRAWHVPQKLDLAKVREVAANFVGRHDFTAFSANRGKDHEDRVRTIHRIAIAKKGAIVTATVEGEGFLYKMVRMLTGAMVRAGLGREDAGELKERLVKGGPRWNHVAPAEGLSLVRVLY